MNDTPFPMDDVAEKILKARAEALARLVIGGKSRPDRIPVIAFGIAHERYAIELTRVRTIHALTHLTPVPGAPGFIKGIFNLRGEIISVVDLKYFFELPEPPDQKAGIVIILADQDLEFGILIDAVHGVSEIGPDDIHTGLPTLSGIRREYVKGVTAAGIAVLNDEKLLNDPKLIISL